MASAEDYAAWIVKNADKKGTPDFDVVAKAYEAAKGASVAEKPSKPFGQQLSEGLSDVPRQLGLTARAGLKGAGNLVGILSDPIGGAINTVTGSKLQTAGSLAGNVADAIGLPAPRDARERMVADGAELLVPAGGMAGAAGMASRALPAASTAAKAFGTLAANPLQQLISGGSAGLAGGYTRETGGGDGAQFAAALAAGVAAPMAFNKGQQIVAGGNKLLQRAMNSATPAAAAQQIDITINNALQPSGIEFGSLPQNIQAGIRSDVAQAMQTGRLDADAVRRLADYRLTGATPTRATLSLRPADVSQQKNLAKLGINSKDPAAQQLGNIENSNNRQLVAGLNGLGASTPDSAIAGGRKIMGALDARNSRAQSLINDRYAAARATNGRSASLDPSAFTQRANDLLDESLLGGKLPADVRNLLNKAAKGEMPLTVDVAEQFKTRIGELQRGSADAAERRALGLVRQALDDTPLLDGQGQQAIDAFNKARRLNRAWMGIVERTPALQAVRDGIEPDKFVQQFVVGNGSKANVADLQALQRSVRGDPVAVAAIKSQITAHLKSAGLNGAADEVGNLSQSNYNKALRAIGDEKLAMFFTGDEVAQLKAIGRVASYEQFQPKGSAVNNSNTSGAALSTILDRIANSTLLSKIPFGSALAQPAQNISVGIKAKEALNVPNALMQALQPVPRQANPLMLSPAAVIGSDNRERR